MKLLYETKVSKFVFESGSCKNFVNHSYNNNISKVLKLSKGLLNAFELLSSSTNVSFSSSAVSFHVTKFALAFMSEQNCQWYVIINHFEYSRQRSRKEESFGYTLRVEYKRIKETIGNRCVIHLSIPVPNICSIIMERALDNCNTNSTINIEHKVIQSAYY